MTEVSTTNNAQVAADLAAAGFSVFPCHAGGADVKKPMPNVYWRSASTSDRVKVAGWWRKWPDAAVGLDLAKSGLVVVDADRHDLEHDGVAAIASLMHEHGFDPNPVPTVATPNQGTHFYFRQPGGDPLGNGKGALPKGIDIRGAGGYVIAPGTMMDDGRAYEVFGAVRDAPVLPAWLVDIIKGPKYQVVERAAPVHRVAPSDARIASYLDKALTEELDAVRYAPHGARNHQLNVSAMKIGQMVAAGWIGEAEASALLEDAAADLSAEDGIVQTRKTIRSGMAKGKTEPREIPESDYPMVTQEDFDTSERLRRSFEAKRPKVEPAIAAAEPDADPSQTAPQFDLPDEFLRPAGLVGQLADWICDWTAEPIRIHAVGAALVIVGTLIGRKIYSRTRPSSAALYIGAVAPSGMGKQHPQDAIRLALDEVVGSSAMHCGWNVSLPALVMALHTNASKVMVADEFADKLIGLRSKNASTSQAAISEGLRSLWGTNTGTYSPDVSLARGDAKIMRPHLSFYGASTVKDFARSLVAKDVTNGLFNRFLILPRFGAVERGEDPDQIMTLPPALKDSLQWLASCLAPMQLTMAARGDGYPSEPILLQFSAEAVAMNDGNQAHQRAMLMASETDDALMLWGRFAEQCKRVAMIVAVGRCPGDPASVRIDEQDMIFATNLVTYSIEQFIGMVRRDMVESWVQAQHKLVLGLVRAAGTISRNELVRKVDGRIQRKPLDDVIVQLVDGHNIEALNVGPGGKGGRPKTVFRWLQD
ncbi:bifunctional DNA primase/polymerase [Devosia riboflavina]